MEANNEEPERSACLSMIPGFHIRHPPAPHQLSTYITPDNMLFQTIHMGKPIVDQSQWVLKIHGLVASPYTLTLEQLKNLPVSTVTTFHECYGSPLKPPTEPVRRVGNTTWTGVRLSHILSIAQPLLSANYIWSDGLDSGDFGGVTSDRYQKDLPLEKALQDEVILAWEINGETLNRERGGPVRLVVPGWFGTNWTKWICSLRLEKTRSPGTFTTVFYNELVPGGKDGERRPVWMVEPNSIIVSPEPNQTYDEEQNVIIWGWAWSFDGIVDVQVSGDGGETWKTATIEERKEFEWQRFETVLNYLTGEHEIVARATGRSGHKQPISGRRNCVHRVRIEVGGRKRD